MMSDLLKDLPVEILAADYKARMLPSNEIYGWFVKDRDLKPDISAKQLLKIVDEVPPCLIPRNIAKTWLPESDLTHILTYQNGHKISVKLIERTDKVLRYITQYGGTGSDPLFNIAECEAIEL